MNEWTLGEVVGLLVAAAGAGAINAVAGGGTILTFPTLMMFGMPARLANGTSTIALVIGTGGSVFGYRKQLPAIRRWLLALAPASIAGGALGSYLLLKTDDKTFANLVPLLVLFATLLFMVQGIVARFAKQHVGEPEHGGRLWLIALFQFAVAVYGGYFGAGIGILMLAALGFLGMRDIHQMNALKTVLGSLINLVSAIIFAFTGLVDWSRAGVMTLGALAGYFLGSHFSQKIPQPAVRKLVLVIGFAISAITFYRAYAR